MDRGYEFPDGSEPLDADERRVVTTAAENSRTAATLTTFFILYSGLRALAAPHVTSQMVNFVEECKIEIVLPPGQHKCEIIGQYSPDRGLGLGGDRSCNLCEDGWVEFEAPRTVPVYEASAVEIISDWFEIYDYMPSHGAMGELLDDVGSKAGVDRLKPSVLRHTYGVLLASKGFTRKEIASAMGINDDYYILAYGRACEGPNPFKCGAETDAGDRCEMPVKEGQCRYHSE